jgi:glycine cleavage system regulatory protein
MAEPTKRKMWSDVKTRLEAFDRKGLVSLLGELYDASIANRRFLHSRLTPGSRAIEEYRRLVADAIYPDPFSTRRVSVRDAAAAIVEYRRSTGDASGTVDLMLTFLEAGTEQAADLGYGDEAYCNALQSRLDAVAKEFDSLPVDVGATVRARLGRIQMRAQAVGWGWSDAVDEVVHALDVRAARVGTHLRARRPAG